MDSLPRAPNRKAGTARLLGMDPVYAVLENRPQEVLMGLPGDGTGSSPVVDPSVETVQLRDSCGWLLRTGQQQGRERWRGATVRCG